MLLTLWVVFTISFFLMRAVPGGPFDSERALEPEIEKNIKRRYNLDKPLAEQYLIELKNVARGDLGYSFKLGDYTVNQVIAEGMPVSMTLGLLALLFAVALGLVAGIVSAVFRGSWGDFSLMLIATIGIALPNFVIAGICIVLFVFLIPLFPAAGWGDINQLILPAFCLGAPYAAYVARIARTKPVCSTYSRKIISAPLGRRASVQRASFWSMPCEAPCCRWCRSLALPWRVFSLARLWSSKCLRSPAWVRTLFRRQRSETTL